MGKVSQKKIRRGLTADDIDLNDGVNSFGGKYAVNNADNPIKHCFSKLMHTEPWNKMRGTTAKVSGRGTGNKVALKQAKEKRDTPLYGKISGPCKAAAKKKFKVWPSAYASGWGVRCTKAGGPGKFGKKKK